MALILTIILRLLWVYSYILLAYSLLSWFPGAYDTALGQFVAKLSEPILKPFKRLNLNFGGLDFSVMLAMFSMYFLARLLSFIFGVVLPWLLT